MADDRLHEAMIRKAISLARKGEGYTAPNPMVGAVVFNKDGIIATGYHKKVGEPHAEAVALRKAGERARGASIAVNLEPCCHEGRTPPCTQAIIKTGIKKVIFSITDPFLRVCGRGGRLLQENDIEVIKGICREEAEKLNEVYLHNTATGRPFVVLKMAQSLDGRIASATGHSQWISCPEALKFAHRLRSRYDAVAVGSGTARVDNPQLNVHRVKGPNPIRIIVTTSATLPKNLQLFTENKDYNTVVATTKDIIKKGVYGNVITWQVRKKQGRLDPEDFIRMLGEAGVTSVLIEGGSQLATSLLKRKLVDKLYLITAPMIIGAGVEAIGDLGVKKIADSIRFTDYGSRKLGTDNLFWGYPEK
ncbi:MAG: bifunctional diaminohydroxyphosphoribosylaminopyrimidine deaminase/5-amino-6-(5-phosphoribosylamino)uracil reductase RibD [FCB group bacterium]|nr:bifunctional diaminohydroxyphosphoribosylaminopyrimidine deaminase/5-amino-6-(5-phosphoribosylamino)uracil reductase RibD [FCB group bacterium]